METVTLITIELHDLKKLKTTDKTAVVAGTRVVFLLSNLDKQMSEGNAEFYLQFDTPLFKNKTDRLFTSPVDESLVTYGIVDQPGDYRYTIGIRGDSKYNYEINLSLTVLQTPR